MIVFRCDTLADFRGVIETLSGSNSTEIKEIVTRMATKVDELAAAVDKLAAGEAAQQARLTAIFDTQAAHIAAQDANILALNAEIEALKANPGIDASLLDPIIAKALAVSDQQDAFKAASGPTEPAPTDPPVDPAG